MENYGNELKVQQGEDWSLDLLISASAKEYIPYIVSNQRINPYFIITIASTKYEKNRRYVKSWWNSLATQPKFYDTVPYFYGNLETVADLPTEPPASDYIDSDGKKHYYLYQYTLTYKEANVDENSIGTYYYYDDNTNKWVEVELIGGSNSTNYDDEITYYTKETIDKKLGHKPYYYFYFNHDETPAVRVDTYECRVRQRFDSDTTSEWGSQNYLYQITLVSGQTMSDRLDEIETTYQPENWPEDQDAQYKYVKTNYPNELQPDIDIDSPLGYIYAVEVILPPTHIEVYNNLRRLI